MARKVAPPATSASAPDKGADDLNVLHPEREVELDGRTVTVREYGFVEGLKIQRSAAVLVAALVEAQGAGDVAYQSVQSIMADHADILIDLMARAADVDADWIRGLSDEDGQLLMMVWWSVNGPFFVRRVAVDVAITAQSAGQTSTPPSSPTATPSTDSEATPPAS